MARSRWLAALCTLAVAAGCGSPAGHTREAGPTVLRQPGPTASPGARQAGRGAGIWLDGLQMTSASTGWALRWTVNPSSTQAGYLATARTTDGARTWADVTPAAAAAMLKAPDAAVTLDALDGNRAYLAVSVGTAESSGPVPTVVFGTSDAGRTWTESAPFRAPAPVSLLSFAGPDDGWLLANHGGAMGQDPVWLYRTTDAGLRWSLVAAAQTSGGSLPVECDKAGLAFATAQVGWLTSACIGRSADLVLVTRDGGVQWTLQALPVPASGLCSGGCEAYGPPRFFGQSGFTVVGDAPAAPYFLVSGDLGQTWVRKPLPPGAGWYPRITFFGPRDGVLVSAGPSGVIGSILATTSDGGATWTTIRLGRSFTATGTQFDFVSPGTGFAWVPGSDAAGGPPAIDETTDYGRTWTSFVPVLGSASD